MSNGSLCQRTGGEKFSRFYSTIPERILRAQHMADDLNFFFFFKQLTNMFTSIKRLFMIFSSAGKTQTSFSFFDLYTFNTYKLLASLFTVLPQDFYFSWCVCLPLLIDSTEGKTMSCLPAVPTMRDGFSSSLLRNPLHAKMRNRFRNALGMPLLIKYCMVT